jgi:hypothetical protein
MTQDKPALEDKLTWEPKGELGGEREEGEVPRWEIEAAGALLEQVGELVSAAPAPPRTTISGS